MADSTDKAKEFDLSKVMQNFSTFRPALPKMTEKQMELVIRREQAGKKRKSIMMLTHRRLSRVRKEREQKELMK